MRPTEASAQTVTHLADRLRLAQTTVTDLVGRPEAVDLIERAQSATDVRASLLRLTAEGERRLALSFRAHASERERLHEMLQRLPMRPSEPNGG